MLTMKETRHDRHHAKEARCVESAQHPSAPSLLPEHPGFQFGPRHTCFRRQHVQLRLHLRIPRGLFFFKQKTAYDFGLGIPAEPLFRSKRPACSELRWAYCNHKATYFASYLTGGDCVPDDRSEERFSRNAETDLVCRLLLEKKKDTYTDGILSGKAQYVDPDLNVSDGHKSRQ